MSSCKRLLAWVTWGKTSVCFAYRIKSNSKHSFSIVHLSGVTFSSTLPHSHPSPTLLPPITNTPPTHHQQSSHPSPTLLPLITNTPPTHHQHSSHPSPTLLPPITNTPPTHHQHSSHSSPTLLPLITNTLPSYSSPTLLTSFCHLTLLVAGGGCFYPPLGFFLNISQTAWARILKFSDFS